MIRTFTEKNRTIEFMTTVDDQSLIHIINYKKDKESKNVYNEDVLLTCYTDWDIQLLIEEYKTNGIMPLLINESIEHECNCTEL